MHLDPGSLLSIARHADLIERVKSAGEFFDLPMDKLNIACERSEWFLPKHVEEFQGKLAPYEFGLIDGCHNWPFVFVDFMYMNFLTSEGGYLMVDDVHLHPCKELAKFLNAEPGYQLVLDLEKAVVFQKKTAHRFLDEWTESPYIVEMSNRHWSAKNPWSISLDD